MNDVEKHNLVESFKKKYKNRRGFKNLFRLYQRGLFHDDILQPMQRRFRDIYKDKYLIHEANDRYVEREFKRKEKELDEVYMTNGSRQTLSIEQKVLKDLKEEHPTMVSEEDIIKWPITTKRSTQ